MNFEEKEKIAFFKLSALGDIVWTIPAINLMRQLRPKAELIWWIDPLYEDLLKDFAKEKNLKLRLISKPKSLKDLISLARKLSQETQQNPLTILLCAQTSLRSNILYPFIRAKRKIGLSPFHSRDFQKLFVHEQGENPQRRSEIHLVQALVSMVCKACHIPPLSCEEIFKLDFTIPFKDLDPNLGLPFINLKDEEKAIIIHPCASHPQRTWPAKKWSLFIERLNQDFPELKIILTGSSADKEFIHSVLKDSHKNIINLVASLSLKELAQFYLIASSLFKRKIKAFISVDTGPIHLADSQGLLCIGLYAAVPLAFTGPYHCQKFSIDHYPYPYPSKDSCKRLRGKKLEERMNSITIQEVIDQLKKIMPLN